MQQLEPASRKAHPWLFLHKPGIFYHVSQLLPPVSEQQGFLLSHTFPMNYPASLLWNHAG